MVATRLPTTSKREELLRRNVEKGIRLAGLQSTDAEGIAGLEPGTNRNSEGIGIEKRGKGMSGKMKEWGDENQMVSGIEKRGTFFETQRGGKRTERVGDVQLVSTLLIAKYDNTDKENRKRNKKKKIQQNQKKTMFEMDIFRRRLPSHEICIAY